MIVCKRRLSRGWLLAHPNIKVPRVVAWRLYTLGVIELRDVLTVDGPGDALLASDFVSKQMNEMAYDGACE